MRGPQCVGRADGGSVRVPAIGSGGETPPALAGADACGTGLCPDALFVLRVGGSDS